MMLRSCDETTYCGSEVGFGGDGNIRVSKYERRTSGMDVNIVKQGAGTLTIAGAADNAAGAGQGAIDGSMTILDGTVAINNEANLGFNLPAFDAAGLLLNGGALRATASFTIDDSNRGITLGASGGAFDVLNVGDTLTIANSITGAGDLTKTGAGTLALSGSHSYTGDTVVSEGALAIGASDALPTATALVLGGGMDSATVGHVTMGSFSQTVNSVQFLSNTATANTVTIGAGQTLTITGEGSLKLGQGSPLLRGRTTNATFSGGGSLNVDNTAGTIDVGFRNDDQNETGNYATLDLRGLGSFTANVDQLRVGYGSRIGSTLYLSDTDNTITANAIHVSNSLAVNAYAGLLVLGTGGNTIHADTINIGLGKGAGTARFALQAAGSAGTLVIADMAGTGGADIAIADNNGAWTGAHVTGTLDLRGHQVDVTAGTVLVGRRNANTDGGNATGTIWLDQGSFVADSLLLGVKSGTGTGTAAGIVNMLGGTFTVGAITLGSHSDTYGNAQGTFNLQGGTLVADAIAKGDGFGNAAGDLAAFNWTGGALHVATFGSADQAFDLNQDGGTLAPGNSVGTSTIYGDYSQASAGTLEVELAATGLAGTDYDLVDVYGDVSLDGYLEVSLLGGFIPELGDSFDVLSATGSLYEDLTITGDPPSSVFGWWEVSVVNGLEGGILRLTAVPEPSGILLAVWALVALFGCRQRRHR